MKIQISELSGVALDWAVAKCEGKKHVTEAIHKFIFHPSTTWAQGCPIIEREKIGVNYWPDCGWVAGLRDRAVCYRGSTLMIAAMRCYVASKLGDLIDIPDELVTR